MCLRQDVNNLIRMMRDGEITQYRVSKDCNLSPATFNHYLSGRGSVDNMRLALAEKLSAYYKEVTRD